MSISFYTSKTTSANSNLDAKKILNDLLTKSIIGQTDQQMRSSYNTNSVDTIQYTEEVYVRLLEVRRS